MENGGSLLFLLGRLAFYSMVIFNILNKKLKNLKSSFSLISQYRSLEVV